MSTTLGDMNELVNDRRGDTSSSTLDMTAEGFRAINGTLEIWQILHDWPWTVEEQTIDYHKGIDTYILNSNFKAPSDLHYKKPIHGKAIEFVRVSQGNFDSDILKLRRFAIIDSGQERQIKIKAAGDSIAVHAAASFDGDGTWVAAGDASNISTDSFESFSLNASINFDYSGTSGTLTISDMTAKDLRRFVDRSKIYMNIYLPTITNFTSVAMKVGSDSSNYYTATATTDYLGKTPTVGWNIFEFNVWTTVVEPGTLDAENIDYIQLTFAYSSSTTDTDFRIENIFVSEDVPIILEYYSLDMTQDNADNTKRAIFDDASQTDDTFLWSNEWDLVKEPFVNSVLEITLWMTGEYADRNIAVDKIRDLVVPLRQQLPSRRRQSEIQFGIGR